MGLEIERKFLIKNEDWRKEAGEGVPYIQGYVFNMDEKILRVRIAGDEGFITIKGLTELSTSIARLEYEYPIPIEDAKEILGKLCSEGKVEKLRYKIPYKGFTWEVDEFLGSNKGLFLAEVELEKENNIVSLPSWIGEEVTSDIRYTNAYLAKSNKIKDKD